MVTNKKIMLIMQIIGFSEGISIDLKKAWHYVVYWSNGKAILVYS